MPVGTQFDCASFQGGDSNASVPLRAATWSRAVLKCGLSLADLFGRPRMAGPAADFYIRRFKTRPLGMGTILVPGYAEPYGFSARARWCNLACAVPSL